jgi:anthranilate phosphoribosyltransferase
MSEEKVKEAIDYASGTSKLESDSLTREEADKIFREIMEGKSDESFLYAAVQYVKKHQKMKDEPKKR